MSQINPLLQPTPNAGAASCLKENIWEIWTRERSMFPNHPLYNQPGNFIRLWSNISVIPDLSLIFRLIKTSQYRVEYVFCRQGMTSEQLDEASGFGKWVNCSYTEINLLKWKNTCKSMLEDKVNFPLPPFYGLKIDHFPNGQSKIFWWMAY